MNSSEPSRPLPQVGIQIIAKAPLAGLAKTRLIPALGADGAASLAKKMLTKILQDGASLLIDTPTEYRFSVNLWMTPSAQSPAWQSVEIPDGVGLCEQRGDDLGERMGNAAVQGLVNTDAVIIIGSDCPEINASVLRWAAAELQEHHACMVPCADGGYALIGMRSYESRLFTNIPWSTDKVAELTRRRLLECGMSYTEFTAVHDIDEAADLQYLPPEWPESKGGQSLV
ncbi:TIGR04282 family arsenosugar biosynthesis glycosyltransferase [Zhongshania arctica]|uniref:TIGR04282 family arsenosugar biosynthesis glycosyltransferase n=1 Tax=Zhongshania arctica TaxID=3238302 RepID=A0ABV3TZ33_9GAMM